MNLVIVESPTKAKTISRYLPRDFKVESSFGHVRDLPKYELGINVEKDFEPHYVIPKKSRPTIKNLKELAKKSSKIILATDEDREGEAIAWHIAQALGLSEPKNSAKPKIMERIVFHEITPRAIEEALKNPRGIDQNLVDAQQARRILDRLVGYKLSPFLWQKIMRGLSAGRVQSVALRLIVEREKEIRAFQPQTFWTIEIEFQKKGCQGPNQNEISNEPNCLAFYAILEKINKEPIEKPGISELNKADEILADIKTADFKIISLDKKTRRRLPKPPYTTSTLQQDAFSRLGYSAKKTMMLAQQLYETGFITYMRTDSVNIAPEALEKAKEYLELNLGAKYASAAPRKFQTKSKLAQEAHEAVRPTDPAADPEKNKFKFKDSNQEKLYQLIWRRFMASQMPEAVFEETVILISAENKNNYELKALGSIPVFDGFLKIFPAKSKIAKKSSDAAGPEETALPDLKSGEILDALNFEKTERQTKGPARYSDATLVRELEKLGIGRPSTYAPILSTIEERGYALRDAEKRLQPTEIGEKVNEILTTHFPDIVDVGFTRRVEEDLDEIASGRKKWRPALAEFYKPFAENLAEKYKNVAKENMTESLDRKCPECAKPLLIRFGRYGRFIACSGYPECKFTEALAPVSLNIKCPLCHEGEIVERKTKRRRIFYGCSRWPDCDFAVWRKPTGKLCPECSSPMVESGKREKCSNKSCLFRSGIKK
jgi:DNA topoisomerase I